MQIKHVTLLLVTMCLQYTYAQQRKHIPAKKTATVFKDTGTVRIIGIVGDVYNGEKVLACIGSDFVNDSANVQNGRFIIEAPFKEPVRCAFSVRPGIKKARQYRPLIVMVAKPGDIYLKTNLDSISCTLTGLPDTDAYNLYGREYDSVRQKLIKQLEVKYGKALVTNPDPEHPKYNELKTDAHTMMKENKPGEDARLEQFITAYRQSFAAVFKLWEIRNALEESTLQALYNKLGSNEYKNTRYGKELAEKIRIVQQLAIGNKAPEFEQPDTLGRVVKLSDFKGQYVLVDFWASWCKPCRLENPNVVAAYTKYRDRNFTVLGISLDVLKGKDRWLDAIHKDGLTWTHVSDLQGWNNAVAKQYGVQAVPFNLLIDPKGKIVAKNLREEDLGKKLAELLGS